MRFAASQLGLMRISSMCAVAFNHHRNEAGLCSPLMQVAAEICRSRAFAFKTAPKSSSFSLRIPAAREPSLI